MEYHLVMHVTSPEERPELQAGGNPITYRFGPYLLDVSRRRLLHGTQTKALPEKLFQTLLLLLQAHGDVVDKATFFAHLWRDDFVTDANLTQHIFMLRNLLGENARDHAYVVTVPGRGYRLAVRVEEKIGLTMKGSCEACARPLPPDAAAQICSYECTFCPSCAAGTQGRCPNCGGELVSRPRRSA